MRGYLLDANHVSGYYEKNHGFMARIRKVPVDTQVRVSTITIGDDLPPFITPRPTKLTPVPDGPRFDSCG